MRLLDHAFRWLAPAALAATVLATPAKPAEAAIISISETISATNFSSTPPVDPATISFSISFDTAVSGNQTAGLTIHSANFPLGNTVNYLYTSTVDSLEIGGGADGAGGISGNTIDFNITYINVSTAPQLFMVTLTTETFAYMIQSNTVTVTPNETQATPEPASLALFGVAMAALGTLRARRKAA